MIAPERRRDSAPLDGLRCRWSPQQIAGKLPRMTEFCRPAVFKLDQYDDDGSFGFGEVERINLKFRIDKDAGRHLLETPLSADQ
jgi:hypothetical protein